MICKTNEFSGDCKAEFTCNGDAALCATAKATNIQNCDFKRAFNYKDSDPQYMAGKDALTKGTVALGKAGGIQTSDVSVSNFNQQNPYGAGCPQDIPLFVYKGQQFFFEASKYCSIFSLMGQLMVSFAMLAGLSIVLKGI